MNHQQIAALYDSFPESQRDMSKEQFAKKMTGLMDPNRMARTVDSMIQRKRWAGRNKAEIDRAMEGGPA